MNKFNLTNMTRVVKAVYSAFSVFLIIGTLSICTFWLLSSDYCYHFQPFTHQNIQANKAGQVFDTNLLIVGSGRAHYSQWIEDKEGKTVYMYENFEVHGGTASSIHRSTMYIPALPPGEYIVKGELYYQQNPIKTARLSLELGSITAQ